MVDITSAQLALRARALTLSVCTTGSTSLARTTTGYTRAAGSFVTDGFAVGMELLEAGFPTNAYRVVTNVAAGTLTVAGTLTASGAAGSRSLTVGLPEGRAWDNAVFTPIAGRPYLEEDMVPATSSLVTFRSQGSGSVEETGLYLFRWYGLPGTGLSALRKSVGALKALFAPGQGFTLSDGSVVRVRVDIGPYAGKIIPLEGGGWSVCTLTIPWSARSTNVIAA